jgi:hypothetical protein
MLSDRDYKKTLVTCRQLLRAGETLKNQSLRKATGLNYDQGIRFFNRAIGDGVLVRLGTGSGTHYVAANRSVSTGAP